MTEPTDPEQALLLALRGQLSPTPADRARVNARLATRVANGLLAPSMPGSDPWQDVKPSGVAGGLHGIGQQALAAVLISAGMFGVGLWVGRATTQEIAASSVPKTPPPPAATPQASAPAPLPSISANAEPAALPVRSMEHALAPSASANQTLSEEARELQRADRALRAGSPLLALGILADLDQKIPHGVLTEERAAALLIARCQNEQAGARDAATAWLKQNPRSVYLARMRAACE